MMTAFPFLDELCNGIILRVNQTN